MRAHEVEYIVIVQRSGPLSRGWQTQTERDACVLGVEDKMQPTWRITGRLRFLDRSAVVAPLHMFRQHSSIGLFDLGLRSIAQLSQALFRI